MRGEEEGYCLRYLAQARLDVQLAIANLAGYYPSTPAKFAQALKKCELVLKSTPRLYPVAEENPQYRKALVQNYLVFYKIVEDRREVEIYRILHGAQDLRRFLRDTGQQV